MDDRDDEGERIVRAHHALVAEGVLTPLSRDEAETRLWLDCELASLVENRFFAPLDPEALTPEIRARWEPRATSGEPLSSPHGHLWYRVPYWILDGGRRAGTIALSTAPGGMGLVTVSSLYVLPALRRRGVAARLLHRAQDAVRAAGCRALRVPTHWTWQPAVRFYLDLGLWLSNWKHELVFLFRDDFPGYQVETSGDEARFCLVSGAPGEAPAVEPVITAVRRGDRLVWTELPRFAEWARGRVIDRLMAVQTFSLALAVRGFPLIRSDEAWAERSSWSDCGEPEGLAYKIEIFEAYDRQSGYEVRTPRIPGLTYPAWEAIDGA